MRWICIAALVHAACVGYACAVGVALGLITPDAAPTLQDSFRVGSYVGLVTAPIMSLFVLRSLNLRVLRPSDEDRWWPRAHRRVFQAFCVVAACGGAGTLVGTLFSPSVAAGGLVLGSLWGLVVVAAPQSAS